MGGIGNVFTAALWAGFGFYSGTGSLLEAIACAAVVGVVCFIGDFTVWCIRNRDKSRARP